MTADPRSLSVLIVDDRADEHRLYEEYLREDCECRYHFFNAYCGGEAEKLYDTHKIDCILLDYNLPDINGIEVLKRLSQKHDAVPAIMITAEGNESLAVVAMRTGVQDYIPKRVVNSEALCRTVARAVERSAMVREVEAYRRDLERSNQDLERFANVVAHDLKAPLRAVTQHLELIRKNNAGKLDTPSLTSLGFACEGAARMRELIEALFDYSKIGFEKYVPSTVELNSVMESVKGNLSALIAESNALITQDDLPCVLSNRIQMVQLLQNLIGNAIKYCKRRPEIHISARQESDLWVVSVKDNGIGIQTPHLQSIFTIFKRLHTAEDYPGTGVGLAICERIVSRQGGKIWAESRIGEGSVFYFTLPAHVEKRVEKAA